MDTRLVLPLNTVLDGSYRIMRVVGSGGFGITYEAEDINLGTMVAIKEYYPFDFGDRDATMSVRPKSERHKQTFDWGRSNFLQEARTLARFEHPSIVRVTRVFEANATAYMVMRFERGMSFEAWLGSLGRPPTQEELDAILHPLLDALEMMHGTNFLHRDIAPDNIIVRADGTPVLLDFGAARRAVAEMSRSLTGIVKAGYSPHEQYSSDGRLQGPWSDLYALGGTLYRAVTGKAPEEATLRFDEDNMASAAKLAKGKYRRDFLTAIDTCLKVRHSERPRSVAQLRPMLLGRMSQPKVTERLIEPTYRLPTDRMLSLPRFSKATVHQVKRRWQAIATVVAIICGSYAGYEYQRWRTEGDAVAHSGSTTADAEANRKAEEALQRQAALDAEKRQKDKEAADARQRQIEIEEERRRKEFAEAQRQAELAEARKRDAAEAEVRRRAAEAAEQKRKEDERIAQEESRREAEEARRKAEADANATEERRRIAALEEARKKQQIEVEKQRQEEAQRRAEAERRQQEEIRRQAEAEKQRQEEAQRRAEAERRQQEEIRRQAEAEKQRQEEAQRRAEAERRQQEEVRRQAEAEKQRQEEAQRRAEAERKQQKKRPHAALEEAQRSNRSKSRSSARTRRNAEPRPNASNRKRSAVRPKPRTRAKRSAFAWPPFLTMRSASSSFVACS